MKNLFFSDDLNFLTEGFKSKLVEYLNENFTYLESKKLYKFFNSQQKVVDFEQTKNFLNSLELFEKIEVENEKLKLNKRKNSVSLKSNSNLSEGLKNERNVLLSLPNVFCGGETINFNYFFDRSLLNFGFKKFLFGEKNELKKLETNLIWDNFDVKRFYESLRNFNLKDFKEQRKNFKIDEFYPKYSNFNFNVFSDVFLNFSSKKDLKILTLQKNSQDSQMRFDFGFQNLKKNYLEAVFSTKKLFCSSNFFFQYFSSLGFLKSKNFEEKKISLGGSTRGYQPDSIVNDNSDSNNTVYSEIKLEAGRQIENLKYFVFSDFAFLGNEKFLTEIKNLNKENLGNKQNLGASFGVGAKYTIMNANLGVSFNFPYLKTHNVKNFSYSVDFEY